MPELGHSAPSTTMRDTAMEALGELSSGRFAERMRLDAAARLLVLVKRVLLLRATGWLDDPVPRPGQRRALIEVERIVCQWNPGLTTAAEFVHDMPPRDVKLLVELAPVWAGAVASPYAKA